MNDEPVSVKSRLTLGYLSLLHSQGHPISAHSLDEFHRNQYGPGDVDDDFFGLGARKPFQRSGLYRRSFEHMDGLFSEYALMLGWVEFSVGTNQLTLSQLGLALSTALSSPRLSDISSFTEVVVKPDDQFSYERILAYFAELGPGLLVDAYLKLDGFMDLEAGTSTNRFLIGDKAFGPGNEAAKSKRERLMRMSLNHAPDSEMRSVTGLHDRFFIPDAPGPIWMLGVSLNGTRRNFSILTKLEGGSASAVREFIEAKWGEGVPIEPLEDDGAEEKSSSK